MSQSFSQIYIQIVFAVKGRESLINPEWENDLYQYIAGIIKNKHQKPLVINGMPDHIHILIGMKPACCLADLIREIKKSSNDYIRNKTTTRNNFQWQDGYGAFSYGHSGLDKVIAYIKNQKEHHRSTTFREEYKEFLERFQIEHKDEYLVEWIE